MSLTSVRHLLAAALVGLALSLWPGVSATASGTLAGPAAPVAGPVDCAKVRCVALTFDDGPALSTIRLLRILRAAHAPATFYLVGSRVAARPVIARTIVRNGHQIGSHSWAHADLSRLPAPAIRADLQHTSAVIGRITGRRPTSLRPPYGATSGPLLSVAGQLGLPLVNWNVDPQDWRTRNTAETTRRVLAAARPGAIVLLHDIHPTTVAAVPAIIAGLRKRGLTLVTVDQLLPGMQAGRVYYGR